MKTEPDKRLKRDYLKREIGEMKAAEKRLLEKLLGGAAISRNINDEIRDQRTFGERVADRVARFGGSWTFLISFAVILAAWVILNSFILSRRGDAFDPYPYILLNLFLSMLASIQAPIIMMSQNRQAARDRLDAAHDYEVNLKAELEICSLHDKLDELREKKWFELIEIQQKQIEMLETLLQEKQKD